MISLRYKVEEQKLTLVDKTRDLVSSTYGYYRIEFVFDSNWEGLVKYAVFVVNKVSEKVLLTQYENNEIYYCDIPNELLQKTGTIALGCVGFDNINTLARVLPTNNNTALKVTESISFSSDDGSVNLPLAEQLKLKVDEIEARLETLENAESGGVGGTGEPGVTFTPNVDSSGNLSWSNNGNLENPTTVNIKGPQGETGLTGPQGPSGSSVVVTEATNTSTTYQLKFTFSGGSIITPNLKGQDGKDGQDGAAGSGSTINDTVLQDYTDGKKQRYVTQAQYDALTDEEKNSTTYVYNITDANMYGIRFPVLASDPTVLQNGQVWYNSTSNQLRCRINGVTLKLATSTI